MEGGCISPEMIRPKSFKEIELLREGGRQLAEILRLLSGEIKPGVTGDEIDKIAAREIKARGLEPVLLGYQGYPKTICISINEAVVHGVPNSKAFEDGDIVKLDLSLGYKGMVVDAAVSVVCGKESPGDDIKRLLLGTKEALEAGISAVKGEGTRVGDISAAVQDKLQRHKLGVVKDLVGHGVGYGVHEDPEIPNYGVRGTGQKLPAGAVVAIEPMATLGDWQVGMLPDGWTVVTRDGSLAAHFEHTVLVTENSAEILTA